MFEGLEPKSIAIHPAFSPVLLLAIALSLLTIAGRSVATDRARMTGLQPVRIKSPAPAPGAEGEVRYRPTEHGEEKVPRMEGPLF